MLKIKSSQFTNHNINSTEEFMNDSKECKGCGEKFHTTDIDAFGYCENCEANLPNCENCSNKFEGEEFDKYCPSCEESLNPFDMSNRNQIELR